ncbi:Bug family tripartite tricarboxylate transporter substrate binding protein [Plastoroseomonas arctica]|uniref:Tripartite tricarboxylate transporter substrate binding protein n=1 Tax=Plastoroseomonas arctica TaxID=1509237 RepID=A0AAF1KRL2_9PROT|nr:tripartite tricarboxylate transporter substrate binding protein [Plastoroseomonas arctica]MBR0654447.1 tripartite tricarboxylate transporter substrate binding protein [Plastoroseomonas arctica]
MTLPPMHRRALLVTPALALARPARAQARSVRIVVPYPPGGGIDISGRIFAEALAPRLGESWVVENRSGANGAIGSQVVARAEADGRTLLCNSDSHLLARGVMRQVPYDPVADFTPIARLAVSPLVLIGAPGLAATDLPALVADIRAHPERHAFANTSLGTSGHLATEVFRLEVGQPVLVVSYRGTGPALQDVVGGQTSLMMAPLLSALPLIQGGLVRAYCVTGTGRAGVAPEIPNAAERGMPALAAIAPWFALWGPKGLAEAQVTRIHGAVREASATPEVRRKLADLGGEPVEGESPAQFAAFIAEATARGLDVLRRAGVEPE